MIYLLFQKKNAENIIRYRSGHPFENHQTERTELFMIIENITCADSQLEIQFNLLP